MITAAVVSVIGLIVGLPLGGILGRAYERSRRFVYIERDAAWNTRMHAKRDALEQERSIWKSKMDYAYHKDIAHRRLIEITTMLMQLAHEKSPNLIVEVARELLATQPAADEEPLVTEARRALHLEHITQRIEQLEAAARKTNAG